MRDTGKVRVLTQLEGITMATQQTIRTRSWIHDALTAALVVGAVVIAASASGRSSPPAAPDVVRASKIQIVNNGAVVAEVSASADGDGQLILYDQSGDVTQTLPFKPHVRFVTGTSQAKADASPQ